MASGGRTIPGAKVVGALGIGAAGVLGLCSTAGAAEPTKQELIEQLQALQAKVEQLEARQAQTQPASQSQPSSPQVAADDEDATVGSVLKDAELRSQPSMLQSEGFTAGYTNGRFIIQDASGNFVINPNVQLQARYVGNYRSSDAAFGGDDGDKVVQDGFEMRRVKFGVDGNLFGRDFTYRFQWATNRNSGNLVLEDAWVRMALSRVLGEGADEYAVRFGQFKDPWNHEELTSSRRQLAVERSLLNATIGGVLTDRIQGVGLIWDDGPDRSPLRAEFGYSDGPNTDNTNFTNSSGLPAAYPGEQGVQWGLFGRVEYLARGNWKQYDDFTALGNTQDLLAFGLGASYAEAGPADILFHTADVQYESDRLGFYAAYVGLYHEPQGDIPGSDVDPDTDGDQLLPVRGGHAYEWGYLVQAGYMLDKRWEVFGRYDQVFVSDNRLPDGSGESFPEITIGVNHYLNGHAAKFTLDGVWVPDGVPPGDYSGLGLLDPDGDEQQFAVRAQFQLLL